MNNKIWKIGDIWNKTLEDRTERASSPRNRIWASELGKQDIDIYLKLMGEKPSNDFDVRALRKFEAGNLFEWVVQMILTRCGVYQSSQKWIGNNEFGLEVSGKLDHVAGGKPDKNMMATIKDLGLPEVFTKATEKIMEYLTGEYSNGLPSQIFEVKSTSSYGIEKVYETKKALAGHDLQAFHYAYNEKLNGVVLYISKDDLRLAEVEVRYDDENLLSRYREKIERVTTSYRKKEEPEKEPEILFSEEERKFIKNFNVEYSAYLTRNYGDKYQKPMDYSDVVTPKIASWNRVLTRIKDGKDMTDDNASKIGEMAENGFNVEEIKKSIVSQEVIEDLNNQDLQEKK